MTVAALVVNTIRLRRAFACEHRWVRVTDTEDQCSTCTVICTEEGKMNLKRMADGFNGVRK